jgi:CHAT domain-containing protein
VERLKTHIKLADRNARFDKTTAREMFLFLIQPVLSRIRSERIVIVPHEDLHYVPFQVFQDPADGRYLGERFQITYAPSASVLLGLKRSPGLSGARLLAAADPSIEAAIPEVQAIAKLFPGRSKVVVDDLAREGDIKAWARDFEVIHLSVHGKFDGAEPMLSHLSLSRGSGDDGKLSAAEMFGLALDKSRLVVLSACETGRAEARMATKFWVWSGHCSTRVRVPSCCRTGKSTRRPLRCGCKASTRRRSLARCLRRRARHW